MLLSNPIIKVSLVCSSENNKLVQECFRPPFNMFNDCKSVNLDGFKSVWHVTQKDVRYGIPIAPGE